MNRRSSQNSRVLAIDPCHRGFGYAVLEGPNRLVDWGVRTTGNRKSTDTLRKVGDLVDSYAPDMLVLEKCNMPGSRRSARIQNLLLELGELAIERALKTRWISQAQIKKGFESAGATTKQEMASIIAQKFPELTPVIPRPRRPWMSEARRMHIFDAVALGLTSSCRKQPKAPA